MSKAPTQVGTNTTSSTSQTNVPSFVTDAQQGLMGTAINLTSPFLQDPPPSLVAPLNDVQNLEYGDKARVFGNEMLNTLPVKPGDYGSWNTDGSQLGQADVNQFFNPYQKDVVATTQQQLQEANDKQLAAIRARQGAEGSYGGNRGALEEMEQNRNYGNTLASTVAGLNNQGWQQAAQLGMGNAQMRQQTGLFNAQQNLGAAQAADQFRQSQAGRWQAGLNAYKDVGNMYQAQDQRELDAPFKGLDVLRGVVPWQLGTTSSSTNSQPIYGPSTMQTALGIGTLGAGILSDRTTKKDIKKLGKDPETGLTHYTYNYKDDPKGMPKRVGPMAQEAEQKFPGSTKKIGGKMVIKGDAARKILGI